MSYQETIRSLTRQLISELGSDRDVEEARSITFMILRNVTGSSTFELLRDADNHFPDELLPKVKNILNELKQHKPIQYILGETMFYDCRIRVLPSVLIPRPETEELVHWFLKEYRGKTKDSAILDIGTGSGCIAIALAKHLPGAHIHATDISQDSLELAHANARDNHVSIRFYQQDILHPGKELSDVSFRYILSNPPYVPVSEKMRLQREIAGYEPGSALFVPDDDPLIFYRAIMDFTGRHLIQGGAIFTEVHEHLAGDVRNLFTAYGMTEVEIRKDINGKNRMVKGIKP